MVSDRLYQRPQGEAGRGAGPVRAAYMPPLQVRRMTASCVGAGYIPPFYLLTANGSSSIGHASCITGSPDRLSTDAA